MHIWISSLLAHSIPTTLDPYTCSGLDVSLCGLSKVFPFMFRPHGHSQFSNNLSNTCYVSKAMSQNRFSEQNRQIPCLHGANTLGEWEEQRVK